MHYTILYIEDNPMSRELLEMILAKDGAIRLELAENGHKGLQLAGQMPFDLILTDLHLPDMDGLQLLSRLRQLRFAATTPVVAVSGDLPNYKENNPPQVFSDHLLKPITIDSLYRLFTIYFDHQRPADMV